MSSCFPEGLRALASGPHWAWQVVCGSMGLFVYDSCPIYCQNGVAEAQDPQTSDHQAGQMAFQMVRKARACWERLLFFWRREAQPRNSFPQTASLWYSVLTLPPVQAQTGENFTFCCCLFFRHPWSFLTVKGNPSSSVEDHIEYHGNKWWKAIPPGFFWPIGSGAFWTTLLPDGAVVENLPANEGDIRDSGLIPGLGRSPGGRYANPLQNSYLENPIDRGGRQPTVHGITKSWTWPNTYPSPSPEHGWSIAQHTVESVE